MSEQNDSHTFQEVFSSKKQKNRETKRKSILKEQLSKKRNNISQQNITNNFIDYFSSTDVSSQEHNEKQILTYNTVNKVDYTNLSEAQMRNQFVKPRNPTAKMIQEMDLNQNIVQFLQQQKLQYQQKCKDCQQNLAIFKQSYYVLNRCWRQFSKSCSLRKAKLFSSYMIFNTFHQNIDYALMVLLNYLPQMKTTRQIVDQLDLSSTIILKCNMNRFSHQLDILNQAIIFSNQCYFYQLEFSVSNLILYNKLCLQKNHEQLIIDVENSLIEQNLILEFSKFYNQYLICFYQLNNDYSNFSMLNETIKSFLSIWLKQNFIIIKINMNKDITIILIIKQFMMDNYHQMILDKMRNFIKGIRINISQVLDKYYSIDYLTNLIRLVDIKHIDQAFNANQIQYKIVYFQNEEVQQIKY